jgi:hypothetical protein
MSGIRKKLIPEPRIWIQGYKISIVSQFRIRNTANMHPSMANQEPLSSLRLIVNIACELAVKQYQYRLLMVSACIVTGKSSQRVYLLPED